MPATEGFPWDSLRKILHGGWKMAAVQKGKEIFQKVSMPRVGHTNITDNRRICDNEDPDAT